MSDADALDSSLHARIETLLDLDKRRLAALCADLDGFRRLIMVRPESFRRELVGLASERRANLNTTAKRILSVLTINPDYLGPIGFVRQETANTRFLAWILGDGQRAGLGDGPARAVWAVLHRKSADAGLQAANDALARSEYPGGQAVARAEVDLGPPGRIDVQWDVDGGCILIEGKVDAEPSTGDSKSGDVARYSNWLEKNCEPKRQAATHTQLERYRMWLKHGPAKQRAKALVLLDLATRSDELQNTTPASGSEPTTTSSAPHRRGLEPSQAIAITWRDLFTALVHESEGTTEAHQALRAWLKSLAIIEELAPPGAWEQWDVTQRLAVLDVVNNIANNMSYPTKETK